jgi:signal transduction histidine kinase/CheY-like chemotaxis protein
VKRGKEKPPAPQGPTTRERAIMRVGDTAELLELAQEAGRVGIFEWQVQSGRVRLSPRFLLLYGLSNFDGRYETWLKSIFREDVLHVTDLFDTSFVAREREINFEFRINIPGGELKWMEARNLAFFGVNVDITERKRMLAQLRAFTETLEGAVKERTRELEMENEARLKAEELLRHAQKMEAVGQLTGGVAHDFNNLLTIVLGGLDIIGRQLPALGATPAAERIARAKDMALQGVQRAVTLTARLLAFSRQQPLAPKAIDANRLVGGTCEFLRRTLGETISLETVLAGGLWPAFADPNQLENAMLNLAFNARDAMPDGGKLTIETANCYLDEAYLRSVAEPVEAGQYVMIAVADCGTGMDKETLEHVFEPFFTTKEVGRGTGLGLSQVYGFVRQSAGHVRVYSELGEGTTVKIYLPRHLGAEDIIEQAETAPTLTGINGSETILVVEDDQALRTYAVESLAEHGYRVLAAATAGEALAILDAENAVDLLFTDIVMPGGMNGRQLANDAMGRRPGLKVLFTTGYTRNAIVHHGRLDPGVHMIGKPYSFSALGAKVRSLLDSR